jgi:hypothetical protein
MRTSPPPTENVLSEEDQRVRDALSGIAQQRPTAEITFYWTAGAIGPKKVTIPIGGSKIAADFKRELKRLLPLLPDGWNAKFIHDAPTLEKNPWLSQLAQQNPGKLVFSTVAQEEKRLCDSFPEHADLIKMYCLHGENGLPTITSKFLRQFPPLVEIQEEHSLGAHISLYTDIDVFVENMRDISHFFKTAMKGQSVGAETADAPDPFSLCFRGQNAMLDLKAEHIAPTEVGRQAQQDHQKDLLGFLQEHKHSSLKSWNDLWKRLQAGALPEDELTVPLTPTEISVLSVKKQGQNEPPYWLTLHGLKGGQTQSTRELDFRLPFGDLFSLSVYIKSYFPSQGWDPSGRNAFKSTELERLTAGDLKRIFTAHTDPSGKKLMYAIFLQDRYGANQKMRETLVERAQHQSFLKHRDFKEVIDCAYNL